MPTLPRSAIVAQWPRSFSLYAPEVCVPTLPVDCADALWALAEGEEVVLDPALAAAVTPCLASHGPPWREQLAALDQRYTGWGPAAPAPLRRDHDRALALHGERRYFVWPRAARPTLPGSTARRAAILRRFAAQHAYVEDDVDGASVLLADAVNVRVLENDSRRRRWLVDAATRAGVAGRLSCLDTAPTDAVAEVAYVVAGPPGETHAALGRALAATRVGGHVVIQVRAPWEWTLHAQLEAARLPVALYERDTDAWLLPCGLVVDGAADLVVVEHRHDAALVPPAATAAEQVRAQPYLTIDFDALDPARVDAPALSQLAQRVAERSPRRQAFSSLQSSGERDVWCWYDEAGAGLTAELRRDEDHLMVTLLPYDRELEVVVVATALELLGDRFTRTRPLRTRRWHEETVFG